MIEKVLAENGLTLKESKVYLATLEMGEATVTNLARKTHLKRTTVYDVMTELSKRGILSVTKRGRAQYISAVSPRHLIERFKSAARDAEGILPELMEIAFASPLKPRVRFYEGLEGLKEVLRDMSRSTGQTIGFSDYAKMPKELFAFIQKDVVPERKSRKNFIRLICPVNPTNQRIQKDDALHFREHCLLEFPDPLHNDLEILMYDGSKIGFLCYEENARFGLVIDSKAIFTMMSNSFWLLWTMAQKMKK